MNGGSLHGGRNPAYHLFQAVSWKLLDIAAFAARHCVVTLAGLDLQALAALELDLAEGSVGSFVGGRVAEQILRAQLILNLIEGVFELASTVADIDHAAAGRGSKLAHGTGTDVHLSGHEVLLGVGDEDRIDDDVRLLRGLDGVLDLQLRALVLAVGKDDHDLAAGLRLQLVVGGQIDRVIEQGAARIARGERAAADAGNAPGGTGRVDAGLVDGAGQFARRIGEVGEQIDVDVKGDKEGLVLGSEHLAQEARAGVLLERKDVGLAAAGVQQDADG